jgi:large subunit ribosomal protein L25
MDEKIKTEVELVFVGDSPAVKELSGVLVKNMDKVEIECLPADLPSSIEVDISPMKTFDDYIYVKDLKIGKGVEIELDLETVVALVSPPRSEEELKGLEEKVESDVTTVEGMVKEEPAEAGEKEPEKKEPEKKEEKKSKEK